MWERHTLWLEELQLSVQELQMWLGEDDLGQGVLTRAAAGIARLSIFAWMSCVFMVLIGHGGLCLSHGGGIWGLFWDSR